MGKKSSYDRECEKKIAQANKEEEMDIAIQ